MPVPSESKARVRNTTGTAKRQGNGSVNRKSHYCPELKGYKDLTSAECRALSDKAPTTCCRKSLLDYVEKCGR